jgi:hypothetical protein
MPNRRPRRSAAQWSQIISDYHQCDLNARQYCAQHDYSLATFRKWQTRIARAAKPDSPNRAQWVELLPEQSPASGRWPGVLIELDLGSGIHLKIQR